MDDGHHLLKDEWRLEKSIIKEQLRQLLIDCIVYNCDARVEMGVEEAKYEPQGNGIEAGMLRFLQDNDIPIHELMVRRQRECTLETIIPFNPIRKRQMVVIRPNPNSKYVRAVIKGAPELVMPLCTKIISNVSGEEEILRISDQPALFERILDTFCKTKGLKSIVYAYKDIDADDWDFQKDQNNNFSNDQDRLLMERDFTFLASFGLNDDLRDGIKDTIQKL